MRILQEAGVTSEGTVANASKTSPVALLEVLHQNLRTHNRANHMRFWCGSSESVALARVPPGAESKLIAVGAPPACGAGLVEQGQDPNIVWRVKGQFSGRRSAAPRWVEHVAAMSSKKTRVLWRQQAVPRRLNRCDTYVVANAKFDPCLICCTMKSCQDQAFMMVHGCMNIKLCSFWLREVVWHWCDDERTRLF